MVRCPKEWSIIESEIYKHKGKQGRPPPLDARQLWNAIFYVAKNGCFWRDLPKEFGPWKRVYNYFSRLKHRGVYARVMTRVREMARIKEGRKPAPTMPVHLHKDGESHGW